MITIRSHDHEQAVDGRDFFTRSRALSILTCLLPPVLLLPAILLPGQIQAATAIVTFDDVSLNESYNGPGGGNYYNGSSVSGGVGIWDGSFRSAGARFGNTFSESEFGGSTFTTWEGFAVSNTTDTQTAGFQNQYSAWPGGSSPGTPDANYAVGFGFGVVQFAGPVSVSSALLTNTTYAALSMRFGDSFASAFGDDPSTPAVVERDFPSWFLLTISGSLNGVGANETVELYLADFRFTENSLDYIVDRWLATDLTSLGLIDELSFSIGSSDTGPFGINTPAYFALDQIIYTPARIPEPQALAAILCFTAFYAFNKRRRS